MKEVLFNKINREILLKKMQENNEQRTTISFYRYIKIANPQLFRDHLFIEFNKLNVLVEFILLMKESMLRFQFPLLNLNHLNHASMTFNIYKI